MRKFQGMKLTIMWAHLPTKLSLLHLGISYKLYLKLSGCCQADESRNAEKSELEVADTL